MTSIENNDNGGVPWEGGSVACLPLLPESNIASSPDEDGPGVDVLEHELWWSLNTLALAYAAAGAFRSYVALGIKTKADLDEWVRVKGRMPTSAVLLARWYDRHADDKPRFRRELKERGEKATASLDYWNEVRWIEDNILGLLDYARLWLEYKPAIDDRGMARHVRRLRRKLGEMIHIVSRWRDGVFATRERFANLDAECKAMLEGGKH